jgi:2',3'-cyclic-nucleotide 2'-phosphodiesterase/3'-nucleotidase
MIKSIILFSKKSIFIVLLSFISLNLYANNKITANFTIITTTDLHGYMMNYNYYQDTIDNSVGLNRIATLINQYRKKMGKDATILVDTGDLIQGSPMADYIIKNYNLAKVQSPIMKVMDYLQYDVINIGNHEFNYGLETLENIIKNSKTPFISSNVFDLKGETKFPPYRIIQKKVIDSSGKKNTINIAIIGAVPAKIMEWDKSNLDGKVIAKPMVAEVEKNVQEVKDKVDFVLVVIHSGISINEEDNENVLTQIAKIDGVDFIVGGHSHAKFPDDNSKYYKQISSLDNKLGTINGVPSIIASFHGAVLGVIDITLTKKDNSIKGKFWDVSNYNVRLEDTNEVDEKVNRLVKVDHENTIKYMNQSIGRLNSDLTTYFSMVADTYAVEIINQATIAYVEGLQNNILSKYDGLPVLGSSAPFKSGGRMGPNYFTKVLAGELSIKNANDLYVYPNTMFVLKISGKELREYLEWSAQIYYQIDPKNTKEQQLINENIPGYNLEIIDGISYVIDVTAPSRYNGLNIVNKKANRIKNLQYNNSNIKDNDEFLIATNNYRANTNAVLNPNAKNTVLDTNVENKEILINYIKNTDFIINNPNKNWSINIGGAKNVVFNTSIMGNNPNYLPKGVQFVRPNLDNGKETGFGTFKLIP